jgi:Tol biopolymer transport system component
MGSLRRPIIAAFGLLALLISAPAHAAFSGKNGKIAFAGIYSINPDGTGLVSLTNSFDVQPAWSPDGTKLAFTRVTSVFGDGDIYLVNADGSGEINLTRSPDVGEGNPAWSPDGQSIAFDSSGDIYRLNTDGTNRENLTNTPELLEAYPAWSPDGTQIAFSREVGFRWDIYTMHADGSGDPLRLTAGFGPNWSPDGSKIAFENFVGLTTINAGGGGEAQITSVVDPDNYDKTPAWSPDGTKIVFDRGLGGGRDQYLYTINSDGSGATEISSYSGDPDWQPLPGPQRKDYKNDAQFCRAEREFLGDAAFANKYGTNGNGANAYGKCSSQNTHP